MNKREAMNSNSPLSEAGSRKAAAMEAAEIAKEASREAAIKEAAAKANEKKPEAMPLAKALRLAISLLRRREETFPGEAKLKAALAALEEAEEAEEAAARQQAAKRGSIFQLFAAILGQPPQEESLAELPIESECGNSCMKAIYAAAAMKACSDSACHAEIIAACNSACEIYWLG